MRTLLLIAVLISSFVYSSFALSLVATPCGTVGTQLNATILSTTPYPTSGETPQSIACVYGLTPNVPGCSIQNTTIRPSGGWGVIAVTEGYDDPYALQELNAFSQQFGLPLMSECSSLTQPSPQACFATVYATGSQPEPAYNKGTGNDPQSLLKEHALDIEMAHAMAPNASIVMVEAPTFGQFDNPPIFTAVQCASQIVNAMGGGVVSNSWSTAKSGVHEYPSEASNDTYFQTPGIVYLGSSGDTLAPANYPAVSPYVIGVGGTHFVRDANGNFVKEVAWIGNNNDGSSGGPSLYESRPFFQNFVMKIVGRTRGSPDVAAIGDNIAMYYQDNCTLSSPFTCNANWVTGAGTSFASPIMAGIINAANSRASSSQAELAIIYAGAQKNYHAYWNDIVEGNNGFPTLQGYDFVTGLGTPKGYLGK